MQFTTIALTLAAAAAASAAATATVEVYNLSKCQEEAKADSFELQEVGDCVNFGQGYGAASWIKGEEAGDVLGTFHFLSTLLPLAFVPFSSQ